MKLASYLASKDTSPAAFAAKIGVPASTISRILNGQRTPRIETISKIEAETAGAVTFADFLAAPLPKTRGSNAGVGL